MAKSDESKPELGKILVSHGWLTQAALDDALKRQRKTRQFLGKMLLAEKRISEEQLAVALSEQTGVPFKQINDLNIDWNIILRFSAALVLDRGCFPVKIEGRSIVFAITNVLDAWTISMLENESKGYQQKLVLVTETDMKELLARYREYVNMNIQKRLQAGS